MQELEANALEREQHIQELEACASRATAESDEDSKTRQQALHKYWESEVTKRDAAGKRLLLQSVGWVQQGVKLGLLERLLMCWHERSCGNIQLLQLEAAYKEDFEVCCVELTNSAQGFASIAGLYPGGTLVRWHSRHQPHPVEV